MNQEITQDQNIDLTPEDAKASLGLATRLSEQFLTMVHPQEEVVEGQEVQGEAQSQETAQEPQVDIEAIKNEIKEELKKEFQSEMDKKMDGLKQTIADALNEESE